MLIWMRSEPRENEARAPMVPKGAAQMVAKVGCEIVPAGSWVDAPSEAIILGLKELPEDGTPLRHKHIMFGHAYKGQQSGRVLLDRFKEGGGTLFDLEYLVDETGRRVAAFGYWAGYAGAALSVMAWGHQQRGETLQSVDAFESADAMASQVRETIDKVPSALIIGALGRVGSGATDLCKAVGMTPTGWDMAETVHGGPFPEILQHHILLNCILAHEGAPVFVQADAGTVKRRLSVIGDIACDPESAFSPIKLYGQTTTWDIPTLRTHKTPPLDVVAIDNLPSLLPAESTDDFARQLLPYLLVLDQVDKGVWGRAQETFRTHL